MFSTSLLHLLHLCDPALPIGGFSHSAGLETYVQEGIVNNKKLSKEFVIEQLSQNICYTDAALVSLAFDATVNNDFQTILALDETCTAVKLPMEMRLASNKLGIRLLKIFHSNDQFILLNNYKESISAEHAYGHYCIAFGLLAQALNIKKQEALTGFYYNAAAGFITNAVKLIPLGQQVGQEILMSLFPLIDELVQISLSPDKNMIGFCCTGFDIRCMQHEQLYSRLYMS
jgi:urease accessory protein